MIIAVLHFIVVVLENANNGKEYHVNTGSHCEVESLRRGREYTIGCEYASKQLNFSETENRGPAKLTDRQINFSLNMHRALIRQIGVSKIGYTRTSAQIAHNTSCLQSAHRTFIVFL
jgi:hypothetical protein